MCHISGVCESCSPVEGEARTKRVRKGGQNLEKIKVLGRPAILAGAVVVT